MQRSFAEFILSPVDFAQGRSQAEGERAQDDGEKLYARARCDILGAW